MIQALNREQPGSGVVAIECSTGCGFLTVRWLCQGAAEAKKRNERNRAGGWHILLCDLECKAVAKPEHNMAFIDCPQRPELFATRLRQHMST